MVDFTNASGSVFVRGAEFQAAENGADDNDQGDLAILSNGNYVAVNREFDAGIPNIDIRIFQSDGTLVNAVTDIASGSNATPRVTGLANGNFVVVWNQTDSNSGDILARIYGPTGTAVAATFTVAGTAANENSPDIVALPDGGFVVVWDDESAGVRAQLFEADGSTDGSVFDVAAAAVNDPDVGVTDDGRILFSWQEGSEIFSSVWDPRGDVVNVADFPAGATGFHDVDDVVARRQGGTINGDGDANRLTGLEGVDVLNGGAGADTLLGGANDDTLDGGTGADAMSGGSGDDTYTVDDAGDVVTENAGEGDDLVRSELDHVLSANVENLLLLGTNDLSGTGNGAANALTGNNGRNTLSGLAGADTFMGLGGNDTLDGGVGADIMQGGAGDDSYVVDDHGDTTTELAGEGTDTVSAWISETLGANIEDLLLLGSGKIRGTGNGLQNSLSGNSGGNMLSGLAGADTLKGFGGNDVLNGGAGRATDTKTEPTTHPCHPCFNRISTSKAVHLFNETMAGARPLSFAFSNGLPASAYPENALAHRTEKLPDFSDRIQCADKEQHRTEKLPDFSDRIRCADKEQHRTEKVPDFSARQG